MKTKYCGATSRRSVVTAHATRPPVRRLHHNVSVKGYEFVPVPSTAGRVTVARAATNGHQGDYRTQFREIPTFTKIRIAQEGIEACEPFKRA